MKHVVYSWFNLLCNFNFIQWNNTIWENICLKVVFSPKCEFRKKKNVWNSLWIHWSTWIFCTSILDLFLHWIIETNCSRSTYKTTILYIFNQFYTGFHLYILNPPYIYWIHPLNFRVSDNQWNCVRFISFV